jgi:ligand-binding sensor domain-containing protein
MKQICSLLLFSVFTISGYSQNKASRDNNSGQSISTSGTPKIKNPQAKTPWPYSHSVDRGLQDKAGNLWFATSEGVYRYDGKLFTNYKTMGGLSVLSRTNMVEEMVEDKAGNIWFGAQGGVIHYDGKTFTSLEMPAGNAQNFLGSAKSGNTESHSRNEKPYVYVFPDRSGNIWFCSGFDLLRYDEGSQSAVQTTLGYYLKSEIMPIDSIRKDATIHGVYQDKKGNIWFTISGCSTRLHETYRLDGSRINHPCILNTCKHDLHNPQLLATHNNEIAASLTRITKKDGINSIAYLSILDDKRGDIWFGTWDGGAYRYDGKLLNHFSDSDRLSTSPVGVIYEDRAGNIWFGTGDKNLDQGNGAFRYDPSAPPGTVSPAITQFTTNDGLCNNGSFRDNIISLITEDDTGKIWFGGDGGLCSYDGKAFNNFTKKDGSNEQPVNCIVKDKAGNLWIGTWELGLYRYDGKTFTCFSE